MDLRQICFPDISKLTASDKQELLEYFDDNKSIEVSNVLGQLKSKEKMKLDEIWARILDISVATRELEEVYESLISELEHVISPSINNRKPKNHIT